MVFNPKLIIFPAFIFLGLVSDCTLADTPEDDSRFQLQEENVLKVIFFPFLVINCSVMSPVKRD